MRHILYCMTVWAAAMLLATACDDDTSSLGIYPESDGISNSTAVYELTTRSLAMDSVVAYSMVNYLGSITDPETGADISADFAAQFYTFENYKFPSANLMLGEDENHVTKKGIVQCDSCEVRLYFDKYYGDENNPMKLEVYELSRDNLLNDDSVYYTTVDLVRFLPENAKPIASRVFTPKDFNLSSVTLNSTSYTPNICITLPKTIGQRMMDKYYENPNFYRDSYHFIRNVFPGLYFKTTNSNGTMLAVYVGALNLYYRFGDELVEDSVYNGLTRFAATPEVVQSTHFSNEDMDQLVADNTCTYLKTPAGICTEMTLPIDRLFAGEHATDSISMASVTLTRYNKPQDKYQLGIPGELLMVRKADATAFFHNHRVADNRTSYTTAFNTLYNTYTFNNIGRLIAYCKHEKMTKAREEGITEDAWAAQHPNWNKVLLIPVVTSSNTSGLQVSVNHDLSLNSIRLVGGNTPIQMQVVYSKFFQE